MFVLDFVYGCYRFDWFSNGSVRDVARRLVVRYDWDETERFGANLERVSCVYCDISAFSVLHGNWVTSKSLYR